VLNGTLDIGVGEANELESQFAAGQLRMLAVFSDARSTAFPDVPTVKESGYDVTVRKFRGFAGPSGMPAEIVAAWERGIETLLANTEYRQLSSSLQPAFMAQADYVAFIDEFARETETYLRETGFLR
jgi:putative tricarboxylic transport membrane protein